MASGYFVSDDGCVYSERWGRRVKLKPWLNKGNAAVGYPMVSIRGGGRSVKVLVHRLVALVFIGSPPTWRHEARHVDGNTLRCVVSNLEWGTHAENMADMVRHGHQGPSNHPERMARGEAHGSKTKPGSVPRGEKSVMAKLTEVSVVDIRRDAAAGVRQSVLARKHGVTQQAIYRIVKRLCWKHVPANGGNDGRSQ
jgi:hypothetical protein